MAEDEIKNTTSQSGDQPVLVRHDNELTTVSNVGEIGIDLLLTTSRQDDQRPTGLAECADSRVVAVGSVGWFIGLGNRSTRRARLSPPWTGKPGVAQWSCGGGRMSPPVDTMQRGQQWESWVQVISWSASSSRVRQFQH